MEQGSKGSVFMIFAVLLIVSLAVVSGLYILAEKKRSGLSHSETSHLNVSPELNPTVTASRKYRTDYYASDRSRLRESPRCKSQRKGELGEYKIEVQLAQLPSAFKVISNILFKTEQGLEQIDHLVLSPYGIFIFEVENLAGLIVGEEEDEKWHQAITWRVKSFSNPLFENQAHLEALKKQVELDENWPIYSYVTFSRRGELKVISGSVFYDTDIIAVLYKRAEQAEVLSEKEIVSLYDEIKQIDILDINIRNEYAAHERKQRLRQRPVYGDIRCKVCQKPVSERTARYCLRYPDKFNYRIYCLKHQKELTRTVNSGRKAVDANNYVYNDLISESQR